MTDTTGEKRRAVRRQGMEGKKGFFKRLVEGLSKTRDNIVSGVDRIFSGFSSIDEDFYMRRSKKFWSWEIWESMRRRQSLKI